jgi:hypothetical protein
VYIYTFVDTDQPRKSNTPDNRWHAITIIGNNYACAAAQACRGKRFLSSEAPRLPLAECDARRCECRYRHFADRRGPPRRRDEKAQDSTITTAKMRAISAERRAKSGRRASD